MIAWIVTGLLGVLAVLVIVLNWCGVAHALWSGRKYSPVGLVGGVLGFTACLVCPAEGVWRFSWAPLLLDYSVPGFLYAVVVLGAFRKQGVPDSAFRDQDSRHPLDH